MAGKKSSGIRYKRVVLKLSGEAMQNKASGLSVDSAAVISVAKRIKSAMQMTVQMAIVIGGGNIIRGAAGQTRAIGRITADYMGMLATVINALALKNALQGIGVEARVQSAVRMDKIAEPIIAERALSHLEKGRTVIFAGGTGNPFFTTDTAAALRASEIHADVLLKATKVDGIYASDPLKDPDAVRYTKISYSDALKKQLKIMDAAAFALCMESNIPIIVFDFFKAGSIEKVLAGQSIGTLVC